MNSEVNKANCCDIVYYPSLRWITLGVIGMNGAKNFMSNGPSSLIDKLGIDIFINNLAFSIVGGLTTLVLVFFA